MYNQNRIALFVDIDNMPLNKQHVDNIINQLEKSGEVVYAKIYGVTDRRHREIICDAVARGFETVPPVYPTRRGSTKVFDIRILVDLCELVAINHSIDAVAIVANPANQVYLFSRLKREGLKIFACDNLDADSARFVDEILSFGYDDPNTVAKSKKQKTKKAAPEKVEDAEPVLEEASQQIVEQVEDQAADTVVKQDEIQPKVEYVEPAAEVLAVEEAVHEQSAEQDASKAEEKVAQVEQPAEEVAEVIEEAPVEPQSVVEETAVEEPQQEVEQQEEVEQPVEDEPQIIEEIDAVVEDAPLEEEQDDKLDILRQIQQMKDDVPSSDDEEDEALIAKIKQLLDEFN